jgi:sugar phosphate isomerase/epimerase
VKLSLSEISTVNASFAEDLAAYRAAGFDGIGIWEMKLGDDAADLAALRESGLSVTNCIPTTPSILPIDTVIPGPADPEVRIEALCASVRRLAQYEPDCVVCLTGPATVPGARELVIDGLRRAAAAAREAEVRLALEPIHPSQRDILSIVTSIPEALALLDEAGLDDVGLLIDLYHVWDSPTIEQDIPEHIGRIAGVHVCDHPHEPARTDRALPGAGRSRTHELLTLLDDAGWDGHYDVEIFSEPERFWGLPADEAARQAWAAIRSVHP